MPRLPGELLLLRLTSGVALTVMGWALVWRLLRYLDRTLWAILNPHQLDYGEGIVWQQMRMIVGGGGYAPLKTFPAIVFHYPPVYHVLTWLVASISRMGDLMAGRALSAFATFSAAALVGVIAGLITKESSSYARWICGCTASLVSLTCNPIAVWTPLMRVDLVANALALAGVCLAMLALRKPILIYPAAIAFVGALFTKQTMLAAPAATFLVLLVLRRDVAIRGIFTCLALGLLVLFGLSIMTHGEFTRHIFGYNINRFSLSRMRDAVHVLHQHASYLLVGAIGLSQLAWPLLKGVPTEKATDFRTQPSIDVKVRRWIAIAYAVVASCLLILIGKSGSGANYYIEWFFAGSVFVGTGVQSAAESLFRRAEEVAASDFSLNVINPASLFVLLPFLIAAGAFLAPEAKKLDHVQSAQDDARLATLIQRISVSEQPIISDNMVILREAGKQVVLEPAIVAELTSTGVYDERPLLRMIHQKAFAFFITSGGRGERDFDSRYSSSVSAAMYQSYPRIEKVAGLTVHLPVARPGSD